MSDYVIGAAHAPVHCNINPPLNGLTYTVTSSNEDVVLPDMGDPDDLSGVVAVGDNPGDLPAGASITVEGRDSGGVLKARSVDGVTIVSGSGGPNHITFNPVLV